MMAPPVLWGGIGVVILAAAVSAGLIVLMRPLFRRYALARPNARSSHREPTPQGGGLPVMIATIAATVAAAAAWQQPQVTFAELAPPLAGAALLVGLGALDDIHGLGVGPRLLTQALAVGLAVLWLPPDVRVFPPAPLALERGLLVLGTMWFVNLVNFMDGIDWMTVAEIVPVAGGLVALAALGGLPAHAALAALALLGAMLGFAPFNRPVAGLFLGDVGSLPIGLLVAWMLIVLAGRGHLAAALLLPLYYLADATITLGRRAWAGERVWHAHRGHFYQRAKDRGVPVPRIVGVVFVVNVVLAALAAITVAAPGPMVAVTALAAGIGLVGALLRYLGKGSVWAAAT